MAVMSKKITYLQKTYDKIHKYCMMNFILKSADGSAIVYDKVLGYASKFIKDLIEQDNKIRNERALNIKKIESLSAQGFSYRYIKDISKQELIKENKRKTKKAYLDKIIHEAYYNRKEEDRDFGGELDIWGNSTQEFKFITKLGVDNPYSELQNMNKKEDVVLNADDIIRLMEIIVNIFEQQKDKTKLKDNLINAFLSYGVDLL